MKKYKKIDYLQYEQKKYQMSQYFKELNIEDSRMMLKLNLKVVPTIRTHFKSSKKYRMEGFDCQDCLHMGIPGMSDSIEHVLTSNCEANKSLRMNRDFTRNEDICGFFHDLIKQRIERYGC